MNFSTLDLNLLRILDAIQTEGSTVEAGKRLGLSQSAVSNALGRLRHALEDDLFVRQGNRLVATDYTLSIGNGLHEELERLENLLTREKAFDPAKSTGTYRIAAADFFAEMLIPQLSAALSKSAPRILLQLVDWTPEDYLHCLEIGGADIVLGPVGEVSDWTTRRPLFASGFVVIGAGNNPLACDLPNGSRMPLDTYFAASHVVFSPTGKIESFEDDEIRKLNRARNIVLSVPSFMSMFRAVSESHHLAVVPTAMAEKLAPQFDLKVLDLPFRLEKLQIDALWHKRSDDNPRSKWLRQQVFDLSAHLGDPA